MIRWSLFGLGGVVALAVLVVSVLYGLSGRKLSATHEVASEPALAIPSDSASIARGAHLVNAIPCGQCHGPDLGGHLLADAGHAEEIRLQDLLRKQPLGHPRGPGAGIGQYHLDRAITGRIQADAEWIGAGALGGGVGGGDRASEHGEAGNSGQDFRRTLHELSLGMDGRMWTDVRVADPADLTPEASTAARCHAQKTSQADASRQSPPGARLRVGEAG